MSSGEQFYFQIFSIYRTKDFYAIFQFSIPHKNLTNNYFIQVSVFFPFENLKENPLTLTGLSRQQNCIEIKNLTRFFFVQSTSIERYII